jgi:hypothetical protein
MKNKQVITKNNFFIWKHDYSSWPYRAEWHVTLDSSWARKKKRLYGQISKRNQFQSNLFFKRLKLYFFYPNMPIFMTDQNDTYLSHYPNATHHTTSDTNMSFIEINTKKQFKYPHDSAECWNQRTGKAYLYLFFILRK